MEEPRVLVVRSGRRSIWDNLAIEQTLLREAPRVGLVVLFWVDRPCVVFGKNQNPWREFRVEALAARGIPVARRLTGGGAVYHDEGNLNYSLLLPRERHDPERAFAWVLAALHACGVSAVKRDRTSLGVRGRKFSGTAFALRGGGAIHHGTLLVASDLERLAEAMRRPDPAVDGRGVASIPAPVVNLGEAAPGLSRPRIEAALVAALPRHYGHGADRVTEIDETALDPAAWKPDAARFRTTAWRFGDTPPFAAVWPGPDGPALCVDVRRDRVRRAAMAGTGGRPYPLPELHGLRFRPARLAERLRRTATTEPDGTQRRALRRAALALAGGWR